MNACLYTSHKKRKQCIWMICLLIHTLHCIWKWMEHIGIENVCFQTSSYWCSFLCVYIRCLALSRHQVQSYTEVGQLMEEGNRRRATASTGMNHVSSRSHAIFTIRFIKVTSPFSLCLLPSASLFVHVQIAIAAWSYHLLVCIIQRVLSVFVGAGWLVLL